MKLSKNDQKIVNAGRKAAIMSRLAAVKFVAMARSRKLKRANNLI